MTDTFGYFIDVALFALIMIALARITHHKDNDHC